VSEQDSSHVEIRIATLVLRPHQMPSRSGIEYRLARIGTSHDTRPYRVHQGPGILEFLPALQADLVRPLPDCEHTAPPAMMASESKPENRE